MSRAVRRLAPLAAALGLVLAGCGGGGSASEGARFAPAGAELFLSVDTDFDSEQWERARALLGRFPDGDRLLRSLLSDLADEGIDFDRDVRPALGPEVGIVALDLSADAFVGFTRPPDREALERLLARAKSDVATRIVDEWTVVADDEATLDAFEDARADGSLAAEERFEATMAPVAADALARLYVSPEGLTGGGDLPRGALAAILGGDASPLAAALVAEEEGVRVEAALRLGERAGFFGEPYEAGLPDEAPGGVLLYASFDDLGRSLSALRDAFAELEPEIERDLGRLESLLGVSLEEDVFPLLAGEGALYVRAGGLLPEVTLLLEVEDEEEARATLARLVGAIPAGFGVGPPREVEVAGVQAVELPLEGAPIALHYATFDGRLVVTTSRDGLADLREEGERLRGDEDFEQALEAAGVPDDTLGFVYLDVRRLASLLLGFAAFGAGGEELDVARRNVEPLRSVVLHGERDGDLVRLQAFLAID